MKLLFDLFPVILFFIAFKFAGIFVATAVVIAATIAQCAWTWWKHRKVDKMMMVSLGLVVVFGGATLILHDETFIKLKLTIFYWLFALVLLIANLLFKRNLVQAMLSAQLEAEIPAHVWLLLYRMWVVFFAAMGALNLFVARNFSTDIWVDFKLFGSFGLMLVFLLAQGLILSKHIKQ